jgi:hypothetical protein
VLRSRNLSDIQKYSRYFDQLVSFRRSPSSILPMTDANGKKSSLPLIDIMPTKSIKTVALKHITGQSCLDAEDELVRYEIWHMKAARYVST